ncbi:MAG TPA: hypothetical protein PK400_05445 [Phycisphaerales bacterium]|nr:hypothetical protein [Phycisphaerales bacterium]HRQ74792.1 hypothetical protein [Phycisphaerales bacterium]
MNMMMLAQEGGAATGSSGFGVVTDAFKRLDILHHPEELLASISNMPLVAASVIVVVGVLCVLNGYRWHKWVIVILAFLAGLGLGHLLSEHMGRSAIVAVSLGLLCAIIATPMLKVAVAVFGGITGAFIGANIWAAFNGPATDMTWAGAAMGFIVLAMASLILFRLVIVLFTSVGGAMMIVFGSICLLMHVPAWKQAVHDSLSSNPLLIPLLLAVAAVGGFVVQESRVRQAAPQEKKA